MSLNQIKKDVRSAYGAVAKKQGGCGCGCSCSSSADPKEYAKSLGYSTEELASIPEAANLALSCGNPTAIAGLREGEIVLDLGSGAGFDCFLASSRVGVEGRVIGVDMTPEMLEKAREIAEKGKFSNVEFRLGEIENLPVADNSIDVVISNCVINLSVDKGRVFNEIYRVLKPGGRVAISDVALLQDLPDKIRTSIEAYTGCIAGAVTIKQYETMVKEAGFQHVKINGSGNSFGELTEINDPTAKAVLDNLDEGSRISDYVASTYIEAVKI